MTALDVFVKKWNVGDLNGACEIYSPNASFISPSGLILGRRAILEYFKLGHPSPHAMGNLELSLKRYNDLASSDIKTRGVATAIFKWSIWYDNANMTEKSGFSLLVFQNIGDQIFITHDASM